MQDKELYEQILQLEQPWSVGEIEIDHQREEIRINVEHPRRTKFCCPECDLKLPCHDHGEQRRWRHLHSCQFKTILVARVPRVKCPEHAVKSVDVPWAEKHSRFTMFFERFAIDTILATQTVQGSMGLLNLKRDQTWNVIERAVRRGHSRKCGRLLPGVCRDNLVDSNAPA